MMDLAQEAVDAALAAGADYADARVNRLSNENLAMRNGSLAEAEAPEELGVGLRVLKDGTWGFSAAPLDGASRAGLPRDLARRATKAARDLGPAARTPVELAGRPEGLSEFSTPVETDPFGVSLEEKIHLLRRCDESMRGADETVVREASLALRREEQWQATSEGAQVHQVLVRVGAGISSTAAAHGEVERRSYPASFGGNYKSAGWEHVESLDLPAQGGRIRDEAVELCSAEPCPDGVRTLILGGSQLMLQIHESVGHPTELDRVHGHEVDLAGASFLTPDKKGQFRFGSDIVNLVADSTVPGGLDTRGFDDEAVPSGRWNIVRDGMFEGYLTSREWASRVGEASSRGAMRAEGWYHPPIIRITNLSLMPGTWGFDDLIADTEDGAVFCDTVKMWSIDQRRLNFQFTCEIGREVQGGKLGKLLRSPTYQGTTPEFWRSCDAICDSSHWELWGVPNCGKGNPMQVAEMSHGAAPARFRNVRFVR